ncbi:hypothetical protein Fot_24197 [Forsythia ovata]|uniref:Uncharacterized protein n=1 Tax=Forsythia ovata TaxID=205694 RepID=A0ABD1U5I1_9LAMI
MSSKEDDSQNPSDLRTDSEIRSEVSFSPERKGEVEHMPTFAIYPSTSTSEPKTTKIPLCRALPKAKSKKKHGPAPTEMRPLSDNELLYLPSRLSESDMTTRYLEWRKCLANAFKGVVK